MVTVVVEDGSLVTGANSYISRADADTYFESHPYYSSTWDALEVTVKDNLLVYSTSLIDASFEWIGTVVSSTQPRSWPRNGAYDYELRLLSATLIPDQLKSAVCEYALESSRGDVLATPSSQGLEELKIDVIQLKFDKSDRPSIVPTAVLRLLKGLGRYRFSNRVSRVEVG